MIKKILIQILIFGGIFSQAAFAQLSHPHFISLNVGTNIPVSDYKKLDSIALGNANSGVYYSFEAGAYFSKFMGIGVNIGAFSNSVNDQDIIDQLKLDYGPNDEYIVESKDWTNGYLMIGPYLTFGAKRFMVDLKVLGGIMNSEKPLINIESNSNNISFSRSNEVTSAAFGLNYGVHFRIKLVGLLGLRLNAEGFSSQQEFETKVLQKDNNGDITTTEQTIKKNISALNLGGGLVLTF